MAKKTWGKTYKQKLHKLLSMSLSTPTLSGTNSHSDSYYPTLLSPFRLSLPGSGASHREVEPQQLDHLLPQMEHVQHGQDHRHDDAGRGDEVEETRLRDVRIVGAGHADDADQVCHLQKECVTINTSELVLGGLANVCFYLAALQSNPSPTQQFVCVWGGGGGRPPPVKMVHMTCTYLIPVL